MVDIYPFSEGLEAKKSDSALTELIDIGGISMLRAAAKNHAHVWVVSSKSDYPFLRAHLRTHGAYSDAGIRKEAAAKAFGISHRLDSSISQYLLGEKTEESALAMGSKRVLHYGENPQQAGYFYHQGSLGFSQRGGKALSYNNILDVDIGLGILGEFSSPCFVIIKHHSPCGVGLDGEGLLSAYTKAFGCDSLSAFGGVFLCNGLCTKELAAMIMKQFFSLIYAPEFEQEALRIFAKNPKRLLLEGSSSLRSKGWEYRSALGGTLSQPSWHKPETDTGWEFVTSHVSNEAEKADLLFALKVVKWSHSNAIVLARNGQTLGIGAGQSARIDALHMALMKAKRAGFSLKGAVMASEAFFPFEDCVAEAHAHGIEAVVQPGGSIHDNRSIDYCEKKKMRMVFCHNRFFRH